ncbi:MAG: UPF0179 family protein [Thermoplasmata archaeon]
MAQVSLIGERLAKQGTTFLFIGPQPECRECKLKGACLQLERGRVYQIIKTRDIHHGDGCRYHEDGVRVVEVEPATVKLSVKTTLAIEGSVVEYSRPVCFNHECQNYTVCHPPGLEDPTKVKVLKTFKVLDCPLGYDLTHAEIGYI